MSEAINPTTELEALELQTAGFVERLSTHDERVAAAGRALRDDAKHIQAGNALLSSLTAERKRVFEDGCASVYEGDRMKAEEVARTWSNLRDMCDFAKLALDHKHKVILPAHRLVELGEVAEKLQETLRFEKHKLEKVRFRLTALMRDAAAEQGTIDVSSSALEEAKRRVAAAARDAEDAQGAVTQEIARQRSDRAVSHGVIGYQNPQ